MKIDPYNATLDDGTVVVIRIFQIAEGVHKGWWQITIADQSGQVRSEPSLPIQPMRADDATFERVLRQHHALEMVKKMNRERGGK
jgi:hypothetical protein